MKVPRTPEHEDSEPVLEFSHAADWNHWLASNHARSQGVLLRIAKKGADKSITYAEALEVALAWGWVDSQKRALDASAGLQRFSRRRPQAFQPTSPLTVARSCLRNRTPDPRSRRIHPGAQPSRCQGGSAPRVMAPFPRFLRLRNDVAAENQSRRARFFRLPTSDHLERPALSRYPGALFPIGELFRHDVHSPYLSRLPRRAQLRRRRLSAH